MISDINFKTQHGCIVCQPMFAVHPSEPFLCNNFRLQNSGWRQGGYKMTSNKSKHILFARRPVSDKVFSFFVIWFASSVKCVVDIDRRNVWSKFYNLSVYLLIPYPLLLHRGSQGNLESTPAVFCRRWPITSPHSETNNQVKAILIHMLK